MTLPIGYGKCLESKYLQAGKEIAQCVNEGKYVELTQKINNTFFGGFSLAPKSLSKIASIQVPVHPPYRESIVGDRTYVEIRKGISLGGIVGYIEGIPLIGSAVSAVHAIGQTYCAAISYVRLLKVVEDLNATEYSDFNIGRGQCCAKTNKVFDAAVAFTVHQNRLVGSLLGLVPLVKPVIRVAQIIMYQSQKDYIKVSA
ncbi:MAG TPA: hypothetical protein VLG49_05070 [Rhabdochlamydiaceae bacterium]|nr:hypothetical protein [Rhabdochlamydiaceae bacterium]